MRYRHTDLTHFARQLLARSGLDQDKAQAVADILEIYHADA